MPEGITLKRIIDMDETEQLSSSDYVLVDSSSGGNRKYKLGEDLNNLKDDLTAVEDDVTTLKDGLTAVESDVTDLKEEFSNIGLSVVDGAINTTYQEVSE